MKKTLLLAAFAAVTMTSAAFAQGGPPPGGPPGGRGPGGRGGPGMMMDRMLLNGITLTDAQQQKLQALRDADRQQAESQRDAQRADFDALRAAREKGDSAAVKQLMDAQRAKMDARRDQQVTAIRALLTSDQYAAFDANVAQMKQREAAGPPPGARGGRGPRPPAL